MLNDHSKNERLMICPMWDRAFGHKNRSITEETNVWQFLILIHPSMLSFFSLFFHPPSLFSLLHQRFSLLSATHRFLFVAPIHFLSATPHKLWLEAHHQMPTRMVDVYCGLAAYPLDSDQRVSSDPAVARQLRVHFISVSDKT